MSLLVKICGLTERQHVQAAIDAGANAVGFVFADSVRRVSIATATAISGNVPKDVKRVAVMRHPSSDEWAAVLEGFEPDVLQTDADDLASLVVPSSVEQWPVYREGSARPVVDGTYLYEGRASGASDKVDWIEAASIARLGQMILAGGLAERNVGDAIRTVRPHGVDVSSGVESERGAKDALRITEFLRAVRAAENDL